MKTGLGRKVSEAVKRLYADIRVYGGFVAALAVYDAVVQICFHAFCPLVIVTGLPCPGCGMTRAVFYFATGQWEKGWAMNPLGILWTGLALYFMVMRYWLKKPAKGVLQIGGCLVACMILLYGYRMYCRFPGEPPMEYTSGNLLERAVPGYREWMFRLIGTLKGDSAISALSG